MFKSISVPPESVPHITYRRGTCCVFWNPDMCSDISPSTLGQPPSGVVRVVCARVCLGAGAISSSGGKGRNDRKFASCPDELKPCCCLSPSHVTPLYPQDNGTLNQSVMGRRSPPAGTVLWAVVREERLADREGEGRPYTDFTAPLSSPQAPSTSWCGPGTKGFWTRTPGPSAAIRATCGSRRMCPSTPAGPSR